MFNFNLGRFFKTSTSDASNTAKNRLQLVLGRDRVHVSESDLEALRGELYAVISRYFTIDQDSLQVDIFTQEGQTALKVNTAVAEAGS